MSRPPAAVCPKCSASVRIAPVGFPPLEDLRGDAGGTILKRCPRCLTWSWMSFQPQEAT